MLDMKKTMLNFKKNILKCYTRFTYYNDFAINCVFVKQLIPFLPVDYSASILYSCSIVL